MLTPEEEKKLKKALGRKDVPSSNASVQNAELIDTIIEEQLGIRPSSPSDSLVGDLGADSLDLVELVMTFEEKFGVEIPDETAERVRTVGDIYKLANQWRKS